MSDADILALERGGRNHSSKTHDFVRIEDKNTLELEQSAVTAQSGDLGPYNDVEGYKPESESYQMRAKGFRGKRKHLLDTS